MLSAELFKSSEAAVEGVFIALPNQYADMLSWIDASHVEVSAFAKILYLSDVTADHGFCSDVESSFARVNSWFGGTHWWRGARKGYSKRNTALLKI